MAYKNFPCVSSRWCVIVRASMRRFGWKNTRTPSRRRGGRPQAECGRVRRSPVYRTMHDFVAVEDDFFSFFFFFFFIFLRKPRSIVQLPPRSYAHASRHRNFIATLSSLLSSSSSSYHHYRRRLLLLFSFFFRTSILRTILNGCFKIIKILK